MTAADSFWMDYSTDEHPSISNLRKLGIHYAAEELKVLQGAPKSSPEGCHVVLRHDRGIYNKIVEGKTSSTDTSAASTARTAPIADIPGEPQGGTSSASPGTVTWSRLDNGLLVCHLCSYSCKKTGDQNRHSRTHTGERPFFCDLCPQTFTRRVFLVEHRRTHTGERPYVCTVCQAAFMTRRALKYHMQAHIEDCP